MHGKIFQWPLSQEWFSLYQQLPIANRFPVIGEAWRVPPHVGLNFVSALIFRMFCSGNHSYSEFMSLIVMYVQEPAFNLLALPFFLPPPLRWSLNFGKGIDNDVPFKQPHTVIQRRLFE